jgi:hypothetical protein
MEMMAASDQALCQIDDVALASTQIFGRTDLQNIHDHWSPHLR